MAVCDRFLFSQSGVSLSCQMISRLMYVDQSERGKKGGKKKLFERDRVNISHFPLRLFASKGKGQTFFPLSQ